MNIQAVSKRGLERAFAVRLRELLEGVAWLRGWKVDQPASGPDAGFDLLATIPLPGGGKAALCVVCKQEMRPSVFHAAADRVLAPAGRPRVVVPVLALPWVSPRVAELCAEHGWSWLDLAGNHSLNIPGLLSLRHTGIDPVHKRPRPTANLSTREAGRVIRTLLVLENIGKIWTQREMQVHCRPAVSLGLVNKIVRHLKDEGYVEPGGDDGFRLRDPKQLLAAWREAYQFERHELHGYFTMLQGKKLLDALNRFGAVSGGLAAYAAFSAAEFQAPHVRQSKTWLFIAETNLATFEKLAEAKPVESGENVLVLVPDDEGVFYLGDGGGPNQHRLMCTNPVQTYIDLSHCGGRGDEAAEALLNQRLMPVWKARGLQ